MNKDTPRFEQLKEFCDVNLQVIKPKVVLATGMTLHYTSSV